LYPIPESFESKRLLIRAPLWNDGVEVNKAVKESIEELPWAKSIPTVEESEISIRRSRLQFLDRTDPIRNIFRKTTKIS